MPEVKQLTVKEVKEKANVTAAEVKQLQADVNAVRKANCLASMSAEDLIYNIKHGYMNFKNENYI